LFGNYAFTVFDKSFSYAGFEAQKLTLICILNTNNRNPTYAKAIYS